MDAPVRILLVEDNPGDARLLRYTLQEAQSLRFELMHASRLSEALEFVRAEPVDVVLLDLSLPDAHGMDTVARMLEAAPAVPIIVLTGLADETVAVHAVQAGAQDYLVKGTVEGATLGRAIRYAMERKRLAARLRELDRLRSLFLSVVTHDLKSPAASILAGIDEIGGKLGPLTADQQRVLKLARRNAQRQTRLIRDLLDVAVIEAGAMTLHQALHPARALVSSVLEELAPLVTAAGLVAKNEVPEELSLYGDADRLAQALANLVSNATKFASNPADPDPVLGELSLPSRMTGPGIAPELRDQLFQRFVRTEGPRGGAGLGLWIVQGIAEAHGGSVRVEPRWRGEPGSSSSFPREGLRPDWHGLPSVPGGVDPLVEVCASARRYVRACGEAEDSLRDIVCREDPPHASHRLRARSGGRRRFLPPRARPGARPRGARHDSVRARRRHRARPDARERHHAPAGPTRRPCPLQGSGACRAVPRGR